MKTIIKRALISVSDKTNLEVIAKTLIKRNIEIIASGGTKVFLESHNIKCTPVESISGNPEAFNGRLKTLSFNIASSLLFRRESISDKDEAEKLNITPIDLLICNLYPFQEVAKNNADLEDLIENIDIGGHTLIRAAAKNYKHVLTISSPEQYASVINELEINSGYFTKDFSAKYALQAFNHIAHYDNAISRQLDKELGNKNVPHLPMPVLIPKELRYGENPHQRAWIYSTDVSDSLSNTTPLQGKPLSYNNLLDSDAALQCSRDLYQDSNQSVVIIKHTNPCGTATGVDQLKTLKSAWAGDPISSFGSIICFSSPLEENAALWLSEFFIEVIIAPSFSSEALKIFSNKKNLRVLKIDCKKYNNSFETKSINGGVLVQSTDNINDSDFKYMTTTTQNKVDLSLIKFGTTLTKHLKSNAISLVRKTKNGYQLIGAGMGNPNRLISTQQAISKARENKVEDFSELILISDAFFPFEDNVEIAHNAGIKTIVQPGGSLNDEKIISVCNKRNISMIFTGKRHFKH
jgi:phosphoribosylaminoimidazolecarboxamide formyltransferase / IMP cyclohydrolase